MFGFSFTTLRLSTLVLGLSGVLATYALLRELKVAPAIALIGAATLAANPLYFALSLTFMTDVPFYCFAVLSLLCMVRGFHRDNAAWLALGVLFACLAILTRQLGLVLLLGFAIACFRTRPATFRTAAMALGPLVAGVLLHFLLQHWLQAHGRVPAFSTGDMVQKALPQFLPRLASDGFTVLVYTGLFVLPSSLLLLTRTLDGGNREPTPRAFWRAAALLVLFSLVILVIYARGGMPISQNVLTYFGVGPLTLRDTYLLRLNNPPAAPGLRAAWWGVGILAALGAALIVQRCTSAVVTCVRAVRTRGWETVGPVPLLLVASVSAFVVLVATMTYGFLDRYMLLCIPFALTLVSARSSPDTLTAWDRLLRVSAWLLVAGSAAFSVMATHDYLAWNRARWGALTALERTGASPAAIDGGYEFNGWRGYEPGYRDQPGKSWWWVNGDDYLIASGPVAGYREIASIPFERWLLRVHSRIVVLQKAAPPQSRAQ